MKQHNAGELTLDDRSLALAKHLKLIVLNNNKLAFKKGKTFYDGKGYEIKTFKELFREFQQDDEHHNGSYEAQAKAANMTLAEFKKEIEEIYHEEITRGYENIEGEGDLFIKELGD